MTLSQTTEFARKFSKFAVIAIVLVIVLRVSYGIFIQFLTGEDPDAIPAAETEFGKIPPLIVERNDTSMIPSYVTRLDLVSGSLPSTPQIALVYPILKAPYGFLSEDRAKQLAVAFNIPGDPVKTNVVDRVWIAERQSLTVNSQTLNFSYKYNYVQDTSVFVPGALVNRDTARNYGISIVEQLNLTGSFANDLNVEAPESYLLTFQNSILQPEEQFIRASAMRVDFQRQNVSYTLGNTPYSYPFTSPNFVGSLTNIISSHPEEKQFKSLEVNYTLWRYNNESGSSYPLITSRQAWENLQLNPGLFIVYTGNKSLGPMDKTTDAKLTLQSITAREAYFAYYDIRFEQDYIQPVWVFAGKANLSTGGEVDWAAYVPAVHPNFIQEQESN